MARTTDADVRTIMVDPPTDLDPFITDANLLVTEELASTSMSDDRLELIEKYLSAHFASIPNPLVKQESISSVSESYERAGIGKGLEATTYGQQAISLDKSGKLAQLSKGVSTSVEVGNVDESWQDPSTVED